MATSRYGSPTGSGFNMAGTTVQQTGPTSSTTNQSGTNTTNTSQQSQTDSTETTNSVVQNMDSGSLAALQNLIAQLMGGGTQSQADAIARRMQEANIVAALRNGYSKEAAFADSQGAMNQFLQQAMEQAMPTLARAAEGSGTSQNSMRALLTQDALNRAAQGAATLGLQAAANYGQVGSSYSNILEQLTRPDTTVTDALLNALNIAKGATQNTQSTTKGSSTTNSTGSQTSTSNNTSTTQNSGGTSISTRGNYGSDSGSAFNTSLAGGELLGFSNSSGGNMLNDLSSAEWNAMARAAGGNLGWFNDPSFESGFIF